MLGALPVPHTTGILAENMSSTKDKNDLLGVEIPRGGHRRSNLMYRMRLVGIIFIGFLLSLVCFLYVSSDNIAAFGSTAQYRRAPLVSDEYAHFELLMKTQDKKIVFIETSVEEHFCLKLRQSCAVESAARLNPTALVVLLIRSPSFASNCSSVSDELVKLANVKIVRFSVDEVFANTTLLDWGRRVENGEVKSPYMRSHLSDALRLAVVHKYSAIYMDLDFIVLRSFDTLFQFGAFLAREEATGLNGALIKFRDAKKFTAQAMEHFRSSYRAHEWGYNGPLLMKRILNQWGCDVTASFCKGIRILDPVVFYPVFWTNAQELFEDNSSDLALRVLRNEKTVAIHFWNYLTYHTDSPVSYKNVLNICAQLKCPRTFEIATKTEERNFV